MVKQVVHIDIVDVTLDGLQINIVLVAGNSNISIVATNG